MLMKDIIVSEPYLQVLLSNDVMIPIGPIWKTTSMHTPMNSS